jgi:hypothetical protein
MGPLILLFVEAALALTNHFALFLTFTSSSFVPICLIYLGTLINLGLWYLLNGLLLLVFSCSPRQQTMTMHAVCSETRPGQG